METTEFTVLYRRLLRKFCRSLARSTFAATILVILTTAGFTHCQASQIPSQVIEALDRKDYQTALTLLVPASKRGDASAQTLSGLLCVHHLSSSCKPDKAIALLKPAADAGNADAQYALARALLKIQPPEIEAARMWIEKAAKREQVMALFDLGQITAAGSDPAAVRRSATHLQRAAELGYPPAQYAIAAMYESGTGLSRDLKQAVRWYRAAAEQKHTLAQTRLGYFYEHGQGVTRDVKIADRWYRRAAEAGYAEAQFRLGLMYLLGEDVEPDYFEGIYWIEQAAEAGYAKAQAALGAAYAQGVGVRQDYKKAVHWYRLAGEQGHLSAQNNIGIIYEKDVILRNYALAAQWYERAARAGYGHAMINLGNLYRLGRGVPQSLTMAQSWYAKATNSDDPQIAEKARQRMHSTLADSIAVGLGTIGLGDKPPTPGQLFDAIIGAGIFEKVLYPNAAPPVDPDLQAALNENERIRQQAQQQLNDIAMEGMQMRP